MASTASQDMKVEYELPKELFNQACERFKVKPILDVCATIDNTKCDHYFSPRQNGLIQKYAMSFYCNPPFDDLMAWVTHCRYEAHLNNVDGLMLVPCYTDSNWWQWHIGDHMQNVDDFWFLPKRVIFLENGKPAKNKYRVSCAFVLWRHKDFRDSII